MGHDERFGIAHRLHAEAAADVGRRDVHIRSIQFEMLDQIALRHPDALPVQRKVQAATRHLGVAAARLHRVADDAVVHDLDPHHMGRRRDRRIHCRLVPKPVVEGEVVGRRVVQRLSTHIHIHLGGQVVDVDHHHLGRVAGLRQRVRDHAGDGLAHMPHAVLRQDRAAGHGPLAAVAVADLMPRQVQHHARRDQIIGRDHRMDTGHRRRLRPVDAGQHPVPDLGPHEDRMQRPRRRDVVDVTPLPGQEAPILDPCDRLTFPELFHDTASRMCPRRP